MASCPTPLGRSVLAKTTTPSIWPCRPMPRSTRATRWSLVDLNGAVVGINSSIASTSSGADGGQPGNIGIGFAVPSDVASRIASELITTGKSSNAQLGVTLSGTDSELPTSVGVPLGEVVSGGPAEKAAYVLEMW